MIKTLSPCSNTAKTAEIMSRYRPIAPKPEAPANSASEDMAVSPRIRQSPYLRNLWPQLQARPTRTRKRGRGTLSVSPLSLKRQRVIGLSASCPLTTSPSKNLSLQGFAHHGHPAQLSVSNLSAFSSTGGLQNSVSASSASLVTLPLLPVNPANQETMPENSPKTQGEKRAWEIDLNSVAEVPEERLDLLLHLQSPPSSPVIIPHAIKPVGSSITVGCIFEEKRPTQKLEVLKQPEEIEEAIESETFPAIVTDSDNKVRLANSAYKEMVGEPECSWLNSLLSKSNKCRRICGEVSLHLGGADVPVLSKGFCCWVKIEWGRNDIKNSVDVWCDVTRIACKSKDYLFMWRFHHHSKTSTPSGSNA